MKRFRKKWLLILTLLVGLIVILIVFSPKIEYSKGLNNEYRNLLRNDFNIEINKSYSLINENKPPFSVMFIDSSFRIYVYKLPVKFVTNISKMIKAEKRDCYYDESGDYYSVVNGNGFELFYNEGKFFNGSGIELSFCGEYQRKVLEESEMIIYNGILDNFSMKYSGQSNAEVIITSKEEQIPLSILFVKRNSSLYFVVVKGVNSEKPITNEVIIEMFGGNNVSNLN